MAFLDKLWNLFEMIKVSMKTAQNTYDLFHIEIFQI